MLSRDKLEYQKRLRFLREAKAKTASEELKLAKKAEESDLTKRMVTLGDKENRIPARGETPKEYNEVPKTRETSRVKDPVEAGDDGDNVLDIDLEDLDYAKISEQKRFYVKRVGAHDNEPYSGEEMDTLGIEPQFYSDENEAGTVADLLIDLDPHGMEDFYVADMEDEPVEPEEDEDFLKEASPPQQDADQSLARMKKRKKATRTKSMKRKSHAKLNESNLEALLRECGCEMDSPFDAPEDEPQGYMLKQSLEKIGSQATDLSNVANHDDDPEPWVEFKVTSAAEQIDAVHDYIKYGRKHRSDMSDHDEMMNEDRLGKLIRKLVREQSIPINLATGLPAPTTTPVNPAPVATRTAGRPASAYRRGNSPEVTGAINEIFSTDPTSRSLMNHLTRMLRGIQQNNAGVADGELANNQPYVNNTLNRRIPLIKTQRPDLATVADELAAQINIFNRPAFPRTLAQLTNKPQAIARIQALINWLRTNQNRFTAAPDAPTPDSTPDSTTPDITPQQESEARVNINNIVQQFNALIRTIQDGTLDLSDEANRPGYLQQLDQFATERAAAYAIVYKRAAQINRENAISQIDARIATVRGQISQNNQALAVAQAEMQRWNSVGGGITAGARSSYETYGPLGVISGALRGGLGGLWGDTEPVLIARAAVYARNAVARFLQNEISVLNSVKVYVSNPNAAVPPVRLPSGTSITLPLPETRSSAATMSYSAAPASSEAASSEAATMTEKITLGRLFRLI